jgi:hypothetical protein
MTMDDTTPEPQNTTDQAGQQDFDDTTTMATPTAPIAPPTRRKALTRPWTWVGIAAAALLLGGGIFVGGLVAGKTFGDQQESHSEHEAGTAQSVKADKSESDDAEEDANQQEAPQKEAPANTQPEESKPAAKTPAMTAPTPSVAVSTPPANTPPAQTTR